jgi:hypothetical protein
LQFADEPHHLLAREDYAVETFANPAEYPGAGLRPDVTENTYSGSHSGSGSYGYGGATYHGTTSGGASYHGAYSTGDYGAYHAGYSTGGYGAYRYGGSYGGGGFHAAAVSGPDGNVYAAGVYRRRVW